DAVRAVAADLAGARVEDVHALDLNEDAAVGLVMNLDVRLAEDDEQVRRARRLEVAGHVEGGVHARLEHWNAAKLAELGGVRLVVERACDQYIEAGIARFAGRPDQVRSTNGP